MRSNNSNNNTNNTNNQAPNNANNNSSQNQSGPITANRPNIPSTSQIVQSSCTPPVRPNIPSTGIIRKDGVWYFVDTKQTNTKGIVLVKIFPILFLY